MRFIQSQRTKTIFYGWFFVLFLSVAILGQKPSDPKPNVPLLSPVKLIDEVALRPLLVSNGKPLLVNFWATWCDPCREEFPDLVKLDNEFKGKIDFITISLDEPEDLAVAVPKFLGSMKAEMPAFLLKTADESALIASVSKEWQGGMPFTILYDSTGKPVYERQGKVHFDILRPEIQKLVLKRRSNCLGTWSQIDIITSKR